MKNKIKSGYHVVKFKTNEEWKAARPMGIGSSEVGAIMGQSKWATPLNVWESKLGIVDPIEENFVMEMGHAMEPYVSEQFSISTGIQVIKSSTGDWLAIDNEKPYLRVSPDRTYWIPGEKHNASGKGIAECKTSYHNYDENAMYNECMYWYCQLQYQLHVMRLSEGYLCFMCLDKNANGARWFVRIPYNQDFCSEIMIPALDNFWEKNILPARRFIEANKIKDLKNLPREYREALYEFAPPCINAADASSRYKSHVDGKTISTDGASLPEGGIRGIANSLDEAMSRYPAICSQIKNLEEIKKSIEEAVKLHMADAETLVDRSGNVLATWKQNKPSVKFNDKKFKEANPDIYASFTETKPGARILKIKS